MERTLLIVALAAGALAAAGIASSSGVLGGGPAQIRVYGGGQFAGVRTISLDAVANPRGQGVYGTLRYAGAAPGFRGDVTCLSVFGHAAVVGGFIREGPANFAGADFSTA